MYYENSLHWVFWYIGIPAVVLGTLAAGLLLRRCLWGRAPTWTLPLMTFVWVIVTFLYRPAIIPVHPWASRRLVPAVLPSLILLAVWASGWLVGRLRQRGFGQLTCGALAACCAAALVLPTAVTTFGPGIKHGGPLGIRLAADGLAFKTTHRGEIGAVDGMCAAIPRGSSVVISISSLPWFTGSSAGCAVTWRHTSATRGASQWTIVRGAGRRRLRSCGHSHSSRTTAARCGDRELRTTRVRGR